MKITIYVLTERVNIDAVDEYDEAWSVARFCEAHGTLAAAEAAVKADIARICEEQVRQSVADLETWRKHLAHAEDELAKANARMAVCNMPDPPGITHAEQRARAAKEGSVSLQQREAERACFKARGEIRRLEMFEPWAEPLRIVPCEVDVSVPDQVRKAVSS